MQRITDNLFWFLCLSCSVAYGEVDPPGGARMSNMADTEIVTDEVVPGKVRFEDLGAAPMYIPWKRSLFADWRLHVPIPKGEPVDGSGIHRKIAEELALEIGEVIGNKAAVKLAKVRTSIVSAEDREKFRELRWFVEPRVGVVYFLAVKVKGFRVQVLGEQGGFISVFVDCGEKRREIGAVCKELFPTLELEGFKSEGKFPKTVLDNHLRQGAAQIKTGWREWRGRRFYGLRLDIDLKGDVLGARKR